MARLILTGATGLLGRNVLFEVLKQRLNRGERHRVVVLGRSSGDRSLRQRVADMLSADGADYIFGEDRPSAIDLDALLSQVQCVEADAAGRAGDPIVPIRDLPGGAGAWDALIHCAGHTSFRSDPGTARQVHDVNVGGAQRVVVLAGQIDLGKLLFIGSAYSAGRMAGAILPDDLDLAGRFANPYQRSKAASPAGSNTPPVWLVRCGRGGVRPAHGVRRRARARCARSTGRRVGGGSGGMTTAHPTLLRRSQRACTGRERRRLAKDVQFRSPEALPWCARPPAPFCRTAALETPCVPLRIAVPARAADCRRRG